MHALREPQPSADPAVRTPARRFLRSLVRELDFHPLRVEGRLPTDLRGTFYRNAPARFDSGTRPHWFDGDGAVSAVRFAGDGAASGAVRLVHTPSIDHDHGRARPRYAGFRQPASRLQRGRALFGAPTVRNLANINLLPWQGRLFALHETTLPVELDPATLATLGETTLSGLIPAAWNAHPRRVASRHTVYQFGVRVAATVMLDVFALPAVGAPRLLTSLPLPGVMEVHDFFATDNHLVFVLPPLWCSSLALLAKGSFVESLAWHAGQPTTLLVIPIDRPHEVRRIETEPFFFWHSVNAFERSGGRELVLDLIRYPDFAATKRALDALSDGAPGAHRAGRLWRGVVDLAGGVARWEERWAEPCEFAAVHRDVQGRAHTSTWLAAASRQSAGQWYDRLACVDLERGAAVHVDPGADCEVSEPALVARSAAEDDVYVLALIGDRAVGASWVGVWDGRRPGDGPLARVWFADLLPAPLHGCWVGANG